MNPALMGSMAHQLCTSQPSLSVAGFLLLEGLDPSGTSKCRVDSMSPAVSPLPVASFVSPPQLADFDPEWENREKGECERLNQVGFIAQSMPSFPSFGRGLLAGRVRGRQAGLSERRRCYFLEGLLLLCILVPCRILRS